MPLHGFNKYKTYETIIYIKYFILYKNRIKFLKI